MITNKQFQYRQGLISYKIKKNKMGIISVKKGWTKNSKLAIIGLIGSTILIILTLSFG
jgi:hypothetical protein